MTDTQLVTGAVDHPIYVISCNKAADDHITPLFRYNVS